MSDIELQESTEGRKYGLPKYRTEILEKLNDAFANGYLEMEDYESRMEMAHKANSIEDLQKVVYDFPDSGLKNRFVEKPITTSEHKKPININIDMQDTVFTVLGDNNINGVDLPSDNLNVVNILGETRIDLTSENYTKNLFEINVFVMLGSLRIYAPDNVKIKTQTMNVLASSQNNAPLTDAKQEKIVVIKGVCILGDIQIIRDRKPGEKKFFGKRHRMRDRHLGRGSNDQVREIKID
jgi:hypothetical protein